VGCTTAVTGAEGIGLTVNGSVIGAEPQVFVTVYVTITEPADRPVTTPPAVILAEPVPEVIDQIPPAEASVKAGVAEPTHTLTAPPPIGNTEGIGLTTCDLLDVTTPHDPPLLVRTNVAVPLNAAGGVQVAFIVVAFGLNIPPAVVDHVAPVAEPPNDPPNPGVVPFWQMAARTEPALTVGIAFTVNNWSEKSDPQLFVIVYLTVTIPALNPVTTPPDVILAVPVPATMDHDPPEVASVKAGVSEPTQTFAAPPPTGAADGRAFTNID
jgi:hypothetical protein